MKYSDQRSKFLIKENELLKTQIEELNVKLIDAEKYKSNFLSNIRNTIINPFASIIGLSEEIIHVDKNDWKKVISLSALINSEAFDLDFQLKNIFCAADIESGELYPKNSVIDILQIIKRIVDQYRLKIHRKKLSVLINNKVISQLDEKVCIMADPRFLHLIFVNVIDNAIKFSESNTKIHIDTELDNQLLHFSVSNRGKIIPVLKKKKIFDRFKKLDSSINSLEIGYGLGLSVVKALLDLLNANIAFESSEENGTVFSLIIPISDSEKKNSDHDSGYATEDIEIF